MNPTPPASSFSIVDALGSGLPHRLLQFLVTVALLVVGVTIYMAVTSFRERELVAEGNVAAGVVLGGAVLGLAIPLAALLATTSFLLDIIVWGVVALVIQLITLGVVALMLRRLRGMIEAGNVAAALILAAAQIAVALFNAAAMVPT
jgi:putative membrane protein